MSWYERFGLTKNPFAIDPFESAYTLVNYSSLVDDLLYYTVSGNMALLKGDAGSGKTKLLIQVIERHKGQGKVVYVDGRQLDHELDIESLLNKKGQGVFGTVMKKKPKGMILLLDNVTNLTHKNFEKIKYYFDQDYIRSVIFTAENVEDLNLPPSMLDRVARRQIDIPPMINYDALRIVRDRFSDHFFLPDSVILRLFSISGRNIKQLLINCDKVCAYVVDQGRGEVLHKYIKLALKTATEKRTSSLQGGSIQEGAEVSQ